MIPVESIIDRLDRHQPELVDSPPPCQAEVALILGGAPSAKDPQMIFIQRSVCAGDPWSGQMAFPGGRREESDLHAGDAARRETLEEIGQRFGLTRERIRQLQNVALAKLRKMLDQLEADSQ